MAENRVHLIRYLFISISKKKIPIYHKLFGTVKIMLSQTAAFDEACSSKTWEAKAPPAQCQT